LTRIEDIAKKLEISKSTVSKALNGASDVSETLRKTVLDTAVEMGYTKLRRQKTEARKLCIIIENMEYQEKHHFAHDILLGFRQLAEPEGFQVDIVPVTEQFQKHTPYEIFMLQNDYLGSFVVGFSQIGRASCRERV